MGLPQGLNPGGPSCFATLVYKRIVQTSHRTLQLIALADASCGPDLHDKRGQHIVSCNYSLRGIDQIGSYFSQYGAFSEAVGSRVDRPTKATAWRR